MPAINIPNHLLIKLETRAKEKGFATADAYIQMILEGVIAKLEAAQNKSLSADDESVVKDRLRRLGYID